MRLPVTLWIHSLKFLSPIILALIFNEYLIYYVKIYHYCSWPSFSDFSSHQPEGDFPQQQDTTPANSLNLMIFSDTHLLGNLRGHPLDKLRREWQMYRSFQTAMELFKPNVIVNLGDVFDEGLIASKEEFAQYVNRFQELFHVDNSRVNKIIVVGNHDIGFHDRVQAYEPFLRRRFEDAFNTSLVKNVSINGIDFITINSMALEGDGCSFCHEAEIKIRKLGLEIRKRCISSVTTACKKPIILTHFPLYRVSETGCHEEDSATDEEERTKTYRETLDCISKKSTSFLLNELQPRIVFSGHTHHGCVKNHSSKHGLVEEWTVASFSWRNRPNPSFLLVSIKPDITAPFQYHISISKCILPLETTVMFIYVGATFATFVLIYNQIQERFKRANITKHD